MPSGAPASETSAATSLGASLPELESSEASGAVSWPALHASAAHAIDARYQRMARLNDGEAIASTAEPRARAGLGDLAALQAAHLFDARLERVRVDALRARVAGELRAMREAHVPGAHVER